MANNAWFDAYTKEIIEIFTTLPNGQFRDFSINPKFYLGQLFLEIDQKLISGKINYNKSEILNEVTKFVNRKVKNKMSFNKKHFIH